MKNNCHKFIDEVQSKSGRHVRAGDIWSRNCTCLNWIFSWTLWRQIKVWSELCSLRIILKESQWLILETFYQENFVWRRSSVNFGHGVSIWWFLHQITALGDQGQIWVREDVEYQRALCTRSTSTYAKWCVPGHRVRTQRGAYIGFLTERKRVSVWYVRHRDRVW